MSTKFPKMNALKMCIVVALMMPFVSKAQLKVGDNPTVVNSSAILDVESTTKGVLLPRVALTARNSASPLSAFVAGMIVYNTANAGTSPNDVTPGFYYSDGSKWQKVAPMSSAQEVVEVSGISSGLSSPNNFTGASFSPNTPASDDIIYINDADGTLWTYNGTQYATYIAPPTTEWYFASGTTDAGSNKVSSIYRTGNVGIGASNPTAKLSIANAKNTSLPILKLDTLLSGSTSDSLMVWRNTDSSVRKIAVSSITTSITTTSFTGQSVHFSVPAATWNNSTAAPSKNTMTNNSGGTGTTTYRSLYESLNATDKASMITFDGLRVDIFAESSTGTGTYIRPRLFNTTSSTITYTLTSQFISTGYVANSTVNAGYYNYNIDGDDGLYCTNSITETLTFDVYFTNGKHYRCSVSGFLSGSTTTGTYHFWMDVTRIS